VQRLAQRGGDLGAVRVALDDLLRTSIGYDLAAISTIDPATLLWTSCVVTGADDDPARERLLFDLGFEDGDVNQFTAIARAPEPAARLYAVTDGDVTRARRWARLLEPLGVSDELRVVLRSREACWGTVTLYRRDSPPFTERQEHFIAHAAAPIADLLRLALLRAAVGAPESVVRPPGVVIVSADGTVDVTSSAAAQWLDAIEDRSRVRGAIRVVARAALAGDGLARAALPARNGRWIELHSSEVKGDGGKASGQVAVIVEGARPVTMSSAISVAYGLTPREREVTALVAQGRASNEIAGLLGISTYTVQDHLKAVFAKTGAARRGELVATIFAQLYEPRIARGVTPGPYGWFLEDEQLTASPRQRVSASPRHR